MDEKTVLRVRLAELTTLRIVCQQCQAAMEVSVVALDRQNYPAWQKSGEIRCPGCGGVVRASHSQAGPADHFDQLAAALQGLQTSHPNADFQFVISKSSDYS